MCSVQSMTRSPDESVCDQRQVVKMCLCGKGSRLKLMIYMANCLFLVYLVQHVLKPITDSIFVLFKSFEESLVFYVSDFNWLCPWVLKPGWMHHYPHCALACTRCQLWLRRPGSGPSFTPWYGETTTRVTAMLQRLKWNNMTMDSRKTRDLKQTVYLGFFLRVKLCDNRCCLLIWILGTPSIADWMVTFGYPTKNRINHHRSCFNFSDQPEIGKACSVTP